MGFIKTDLPVNLSYITCKIYEDEVLRLPATILKQNQLTLIILFLVIRDFVCNSGLFIVTCSTCPAVTKIVLPICHCHNHTQHLDLHGLSEEQELLISLGMWSGAGGVVAGRVTGSLWDQGLAAPERHVTGCSTDSVLFWRSLWKLLLWVTECTACVYPLYLFYLSLSSKLWFLTQTWILHHACCSVSVIQALILDSDMDLASCKLQRLCRPSFDSWLRHGSCIMPVAASLSSKLWFLTQTWILHHACCSVSVVQALILDSDMDLASCMLQRLCRPSFDSWLRHGSCIMHVAASLSSKLWFLTQTWILHHACCSVSVVQALILDSDMDLASCLLQRLCRPSFDSWLRHGSCIMHVAACWDKSWELEQHVVKVCSPAAKEIQAAFSSLKSFHHPTLSDPVAHGYCRLL